jgi:hypothetical protein
MKSIPYQTLIRQWLADGIRKELHLRSRSRGGHPPVSLTSEWRKVGRCPGCLIRLTLPLLLRLRPWPPSCSDLEGHR